MQGFAWIHAFIVLLCFVATVESGLFEGSNVLDLDAESFESKVLNGEELWVIKWYANWCGGCQMVAPWYTEAANLLKAEGINFGAMNMDVHAGKGRSYGVQGMPHIMAFHPGKPSAPVGMAGLGGAQSIIDFARREYVAHGLREHTEYMAKSPPPDPSSLAKEHMKRPPAPAAGPSSPPGQAPIIQPTDGSTPAFTGNVVNEPRDEL